MLRRLFVALSILTVIVSACSPAAVSETPTTNTPSIATPIPDTVRTHDFWGNERMVCPAVFKANLIGEVTMTKNVEITFDTSGYLGSNSDTWLIDWTVQVSDFQQAAAAQADALVREALGLENIGVGIYSWDLLFETQLLTIPPAYYDETNCPDDWVVTFNLVPSYQIVGGDRWAVSVSIVNGAAYVEVTDLLMKNMVEVPIYSSDITTLMQGYDPGSITLSDPAVHIGSTSYEDAVISYAAGIEQNGLRVGRFSWYSIQGQDVILSVLAHATILKAARDPNATHLAAFFAYLRERTLTSTDLKISSSPTHGSFFLGIGSVSGGGTSVSFHEAQSNEPTISGVLYVLNSR